MGGGPRQTGQSSRIGLGPGQDFAGCCWDSRDACSQSISGTPLFSNAADGLTSENAGGIGIRASLIC